MTKIKICGLMNLADIQAVNNAQPDLAGFIFANGRHHLDFEQAKKMRAELAPNINSVGVFVNAPIEEMLKAVKAGIVSMIQLHGQEDETVVKKLQQQHIPVINVFKPHNLRNTAADYIMLDSGSGDGSLIQWDQLNLSIKKPLFIAGALNFDNVAKAIAQTHPEFVDLSRGVETDGHKDADKIKNIVNLVHQI